MRVRWQDTCSTNRPAARHVIAANLSFQLPARSKIDSAHNVIAWRAAQNMTYKGGAVQLMLIGGQIGADIERRAHETMPGSGRRWPGTPR